LQLLRRKRRIELDEETEPWVRKTLDLLQLNEAPLTIDVAKLTLTQRARFPQNP